MAVIKTLTDESGTYDVEIVIESDGWSGTPLVANSSDDHFQFDIWGEIEVSGGAYDGYTFTCEPDPTNYGYCALSSGDRGSIIGMSLEHMGMAIDTDNEHAFQAVGCHPNWSYSSSWGAKEDDQSLRIECNDVSIHKLKLIINDGISTTESYYNDEELGRYFQYSPNVGIIFFRVAYIGDGSSRWRARIKTDLPIFETDADLLEYCQSGGTITNKILNLYVDPEEEYEEARQYKYVRNIFGHNANNPTQYTGYRNYRFYGGDGKICFYVTQATSGHPFTLKLFNYSSYTCKEAAIYDYDDESYTDASASPATDYLDTSIQFSSSNWYKCFQWNTNMLIFGSKAQAEMWRDDLIDARQALNYDKVSRAYNEILDPEYGNADPGYDNGINGQSYVHGARMWVMTSGQLNNFFDDIFDPVNIQNILDGTKLFGSNEIQAIQGITYFPLDLDDVATVYSSAQAIKIGSFTCPTATGRYVQNNNKLLNCGKVFINPVYNDFRDYRIKLFISLPYCGVHELNISKFLHHYLEVYYAVDITTGACSAHVLADGISYGDTFDGFMASQRPITALDQTAYLNSVMSSVSSIVHREAGMISDAKSAIAGVATGNTKGATSGPSGLDISSGAISDLYNLSQAVKDAPMTSRGGFAGCLGFFGNQQIHIITVQSKTVKPSLEQQIVGYPSHVSQRIGNFSGFLKTSAINLNNFSGTAQELEDIHNALSKGIYI